MTRMSKQGKRRHMTPKRRKAPSAKTGPKPQHSFKEHINALSTEEGQKTTFISKIK